MTRARSFPLVGIGAGLALLLLYLPLVLLVLGAFVDRESGFTLIWFERSFQDEAILQALGLSLQIAFGSALISAALGTVAALAIERGRFPGKRALVTVIHASLVMPEIVFGLSLLIWFVLLRVTLGPFSILLAHVTFSLAYVILAVRARLEGLDGSFEEAARDLGASSWQTFWKVTLPTLRPAIVSGAAMGFTLSFDDFLVTFFTTGPGSDTLPLKVYAMIKFGVSPEINALSTLMMAVTIGLVLIFVPFREATARRSRRSGEAAHSRS